ncbi:MAG: hypothetical protein AAFN41_05740, partial [Planctomycetota bacterium]
MRTFGRLICMSVFVSAPSANAQDLLDSATWIESDIGARGAVYDRARDLIYTTIGSSAGAPTGNSLSKVDPGSLAITQSINIGSEPRLLAISDDSSAVYVGIDGARAFRSFDPATNGVGSLVPLFTGSFNDPSVVEDIAVAPGRPDTVLIVRDQVGSSADGDLGVYRGGVEVGGTNTSFPDTNSIAFDGPDRVVAFNNSNTGFDLTSWDFDGSNLQQDGRVGSIVSGFGIEIEVAGGMVFSETGVVADASTLGGLGTFTGAGGAVEPIAELGITYFLSGGELRVYDNST